MKPMADDQLLLFPSRSWTEDSHLTVAASGQKLRRWGSVEEACKILDDCDRDVIYDLIGIDQVAAYKRRPHRPNSHWRVDLLSVWNHKQKQLPTPRSGLK